MKKLPSLLLGVCLFFGAISARADLFNYSYTFGNPGTPIVVSGSLQGTQNGIFVENVSNMTLFFNGVQAVGTIYGAQEQYSTGFWIAGPVVSFDLSQNNFFFVNRDYLGGETGWDEFFYLTPDSLAYYAYAYSGPNFLSVGDRSAGQWSLTSVNGVPDAGSTVALLGLSMLGLGFLRRRA